MKILRAIMAFIIDFFFIIVFVEIIGLLLTYNLGDFGISVKGYTSVIDGAIIISYFIFTPIFFGNTFGRKILRIKEKYRWFRRWNPEEDKIPHKFPAGKLKKTETLKVVLKDGFWTCPSCKERNKELQDICSNCGQEVDKS